MTIVIETPQGSHQKYNYDESSRFFRLKKVLPSGMVFPFDFGFIPGTKGGDGDPIDVLLLSEYASFPGCMLDCRLIGGLKATEREGKGKKVRNDRLIAVSAHSRIFSPYESLNDMPRELLAEIENFFVNYVKADGKTFTVEGRISAKEAIKMVEKAQIEEGNIYHVLDEASSGPFSKI